MHYSRSLDFHKHSTLLSNYLYLRLYTLFSHYYSWASHSPPPTWGYTSKNYLALLNYLSHYYVFLFSIKHAIISVRFTNLSWDPIPPSSYFHIVLFPLIVKLLEIIIYTCSLQFLFLLTWLEWVQERTALVMETNCMGCLYLNCRYEMFQTHIKAQKIKKHMWPN